jgi:GntR family transcriptional regulator
MSAVTERDRRPLPLQLREEILALIERERLRPGDRLPSETEIATRFDVGRTTAREALKLLEQDGVIDVRHGSGRYVSHVATLERPITRLESVTEMMRAHGYTVSNRVVSVTRRPADPEESAVLDLPSGAEVVRLERVRLHEGEPLIYSVDVFPRALLPAAALEDIDWTGSLLELLERSGWRVTSAVAQLQAVRLPPDARRAMGRRTSEPWVLLVHRNIDETGRVVILSRDYYRGDRFTFNVFRRRD